MKRNFMSRRNVFNGGLTAQDRNVDINIGRAI
jgi:hypothetical protein